MSFNYGLRHGTVLKLTSGSSSSASAAFTAGTEYIRVVSTKSLYQKVKKDKWNLLDIKVKVDNGKT